MTSLVLGATGFVGRALVRALVGDGGEVRAASRKGPSEGGAPEGGDPALASEGGEGSGRLSWVTCDLRQPETLPDALRGVNWVFYLVHSMGKGSGNYRETERQSAEALAAAAAAAGCSRIIYLGGVAPRGTPSEHLASRLQVGEVLRAGPVPAIELRASMIVGNGGASWKIVRDLSLRLPIMILPRWLSSKSCPIALEDVVTALLDARRIALPQSAWFDIPGPDALSARKMLEIVGKLRGRRVPMIPVPVLSPRLSALWLRFVTDADRDIARELVLGLRHDLLPKDARYWQVTGHPPKLTFEQAARRALSTESETRSENKKEP